ncbi:quinoprotein relay system zinc metallohydrolase 1 [Algiphilus aromaticivorans]|uniref:quinoprotein relay system zinc metallohydrolase 1 n=1 Tax=Algiphilus aromaticivorans TaxID=382454 RepID=UPI0018DC72A6|nr:quinoprotein relay system zinc metallohydrolase 1 [Algiphilus aromaticivorans]
MRHAYRRGVASTLALLLMTFAEVTAAADYELLAEEVAEGVWVVPGTTEGFSRDNGGHMLNTGFVVTDEGAVIVDPGPTLRYGEQLRALAESKAGGAIARVYLTHHHPDHALGALAFGDVPVHALPATIAVLERDGHKLLDNFYRLLGDWMRGTRVHLPTQSAEPGQVDIGGRRLQVLALSGHSGAGADLAILDVDSRVLFAGDIVFNARAPATADADIGRWLTSLEAVAALAPEQIVPGHGPLAAGLDALKATRDWLDWLDNTMRDGASRGRSMGEMLNAPIPKRFASWGQARRELQRSVNHLYSSYSTAALDWN